MKVAHIVGKLKAAGVESVVFTYLRFMDREGMEIDVLYDADSTVEPPRDLEEAGIRFIKIPPYQKLPEYMKTLRRLFREEKYDIVHSHINSLSVFPLRAAKSAGVMYRICHNHTTSSKAEFVRNAVKNLLKPFARRAATHYAACSGLSARWLYGDKIVESGAVKIFPNAIDIDKYKYSSDSRERIRSEFGISDKFVVGHIGRFMSTKNHCFIIDLFSELLKIRPDVALVLVGDGERKKEVEKRVESLGLADRVFFPGVVFDAEQYYSAFDVFVLPSLYEGLPVVALEAQTSGLECFVSDVVTRECAVTPHVNFIPLDAGSEEWAKHISARAVYDRLSDGEIVQNSKFNIVRSAGEMKDFYKMILSGDAD